MLLTEVFLSDPFSVWTVNSFLLLVCRASANKTSGKAELLRTGRGFGHVGNGVMTSGVCQQQSCFHHHKNENKDLLQDFTESKYLQFNNMTCGSGKYKKVPVQWFSLMQHFSL